jgi:hypothetical protein
MIGLRLRPEVRQRIETWAQQNELRFSDAVRHLLEVGLDVEAKRKR